MTASLNTQSLGQVIEMTAATMLFLLPFFFLPFFTDYILVSKNILLLLGTIVMVIGWVWMTIQSRVISLHVGKWFIPMLGFVGITVLSAFVNRFGFDQFLFSSGVGYIALLATIVILPGTIRKGSGRSLVMSATGGLMVMGLLTLFESIGYGPSYLSGLVGVNIDPSVFLHPLGSVVAGLAILIPFFLGWVVDAIFTPARRFISASLALGLGLALALHIFLLLPGKPSSWSLPSYGSGWIIALETLKNPVSALIGVGPDAYPIAFTRFRPLELNYSSNWTARYTESSSELFTLFTTVGILGTLSVATLGWLVWRELGNTKALKTVQTLDQDSRLLLMILIGTIGSTLFLPISLTQILISAMLLAIYCSPALLGETRDQSDAEQFKSSWLQSTVLQLHAVATQQSGRRSSAQTQQAPVLLSSLVSGMIGIVIVLLTSVWTWQSLKMIQSEYLYFQSLLAAEKNDGAKTYDLQSRAIQLNPTNDRLRRAFASTNFLIAANLAENQETTQELRQNIPQIIQQSISEAKLAVELNPNRVQNWETLSEIYRALIGSVDRAEQWSVAGLVQAITTDPTNPQLRLSLGGILLSQDQSSEALRMIQQAIELKSDWPNAHFNLAFVYESEQEYRRAVQSLETTLSLLPAEDPQRARVQAKLTELQPLAEEEQAKIDALQAQRNPGLNQGSQIASPAQDSVIEPEGQVLPPTTGEIRIPEEFGLPEAEPPVSIPN